MSNQEQTKETNKDKREKQFVGKYLNKKIFTECMRKNGIKGSACFVIIYLVEWMISYFAKEGKIRKKCNPYRKNSTMAEVGYFHKTKTYRNEVYFLFKYKHILNIDEFFKYCYSSKSSTRMIKIYLDKISCDANEYDYIPNEDANKYKLFKKITLEKQEDKSKMKKSLNKILN